MMRRMMLSLVLCSLGTAKADETVLVAKELRTVAPAVTDLTFDCPAFSIEHQVRLELEARIDFPTLAGSNPWLRVQVNDNPVSVEDLLNKRNDFKLVRGLDLTWAKYGDHWRVLYSPDFTAALAPAEPNAAPDDDPYHFVWDITADVRPGENRLKLIHLQVLTDPSTMIVRNVQITVGQPIEAPRAEAVQPAPTGPLESLIAVPPAPVDYQVARPDGRTIELTAHGRTHRIETASSLPGGRWDDSPATVQPDGATSWRNSLYEVERRLDRRDDHLLIADTFRNLTDQMVGVIVKHELTATPTSTRLAGRQTVSERGATSIAYHPTLWLEWPDAGLGLAAEDDIFRVHHRAYRTGDVYGLADERLGLPPGGEITLEWSVWPVAGDYWTFINTLRRAWDANQTIPGPFSFTMHLPPNMPAEWYADWMRARDLKIAAGGIPQYPDGVYAHGTGVLFAPEWVARNRQWMQAVKAQAPEVAAVSYFHAQCSTEPGGTEKYADSRLLDQQGEQIQYPYRYPLPLYLPTRDNSYGKALWDVIRTLTEGVDSSGIYWDEMSHSVLQFTAHGPWDGCSAQIDPATHELLGPLTSVTLLMQPLKLDLVHHLRNRGLFLMANSPAPTRTMAREKILRFVETNTYQAVFDSHLSTPVGLANHHPETTQADSAIQVREQLDRGGLFYGHLFNREPPAWNFQSLLYPLTPVELHEGYILAAERIVTHRSGIFGWPDGAAAEVFVVDAKGERVAAPQVEELVEHGQHRYAIRMPSDQFAVLVRRERD